MVIKRTRRFYWDFPVAPFLVSIIFSLPSLQAQQPDASDRAGIEHFEDRIFDDGDNQTTDMPYRLFIPVNYNVEKRYPLVIFLHGRGEAGNDNVKQLSGQPSIMNVVNAANRAKYPLFFAAPQSINSSFTGDPQRSQLMGMIDSIQNEFSIDPERIYMTGLSQGGNGAYVTALNNPTLFAALGIMAGFGDSTRASSLSDVPTWFVHGEDDDIVSVENSRRIVSALRSVGASVIYSELPGWKHDSWKFPYGGDEFFEWLLAQRRGARSMRRGSYPGIQITGYQKGQTASVTGVFWGEANVDSISWSNSKGGNGTEIGSEEWNVSGIPLQKGENVINVIAQNESYTSINDSIKIFLNGSDAHDSQPPVIGLATITSGNLIVSPTGEVTLYGFAYDDLDELLEIEWSVNGAVIGTMQSSPEWEIPLAFEAGNYSVLLVARDTSGNESGIRVWVNVEPNEPPKVVSPEELEVLLPLNEVTLDAQVSDDGKPQDALNITWVSDGGSAPVEIKEPYSSHSKVRFSGPGVYYFRLTATDLELATERALKVRVVEPTPLQAWRRKFFETTGNDEAANDFADPDKDQFVNLAEYFFQSDPTDGKDSGGLFLSRITDQSGSILSLESGSIDEIEEVNAVLECSEDLINWSDIRHSIDNHDPSEEGKETTLLWSEDLGKLQNPMYFRFRLQRVPFEENKTFYLNEDTSCRGNWMSKFGSLGYDIPLYGKYLPDWIELRYQGGSTVLWDYPTRDPRALQVTNGSRDRIASAYESPSKILVSSFLWDRSFHYISLYFLDWFGAHLRQRIDVYDANSNELLDSVLLSESFENGIYLTWRVRGMVRFEISPLASGNAVLSGFFVD